MRNLILASAATSLLLIVSCTSVQDTPVAASGQAASAGSSREFVARIVGDTEDVWGALFKQMGASPYPEPRVVLFSGSTQSGCGVVRTALAPIYCAADDKVYVDVAFVDDVRTRAGRQPDFAAAYLIVHAISRHVQRALSAAQHVQSAPPSGNPPQDDLVLSLQADCYTGVWVHFVQQRDLLEPGDLEDGLPAALLLGDPSTHGANQQRLSWFNRGLAGDPEQCRTTN